MSSLRVETLRLVWLETFIAVAKQENISAAARSLALSQPMVSRYMQDLEAWLGKRLIAPGKINDPEDARVSVGLTDDGHAFVETAEKVVAALQECRSDQAKREDMVNDMRDMIDKLKSDRKLSLKVCDIAQSSTEYFEKVVDAITSEVPLVAVAEVRKQMRWYFADYEKDKAKELRRKKGRKLSGI